jgi:hypothetical protein
MEDKSGEYIDEPLWKHSLKCLNHSPPLMTATRITLEMTALIQKAVGGPIMTEEEINKVAAGETGEEEALSSEEDASDAALNPESISAMDSELPSASDTTATSPSIRQYPM